ncbi:MAG: tRNA pseudouridine(38-40) synthase TruA [Propioniciclava sp.]
MTRYRLDLAYNGSAFRGWATQDGLRTVQGDLESWLGTILRLDEPPRLTVAGRTDAGVHARGQVAHVDLDEPALADTLAHRLRRALPEDIVVRAVTEVPATFDARFSAIWRRYVYRLADQVADPLHRGMVVAVNEPLDPDAMDAAAAALVGLHDYGAFCRHKKGATTIRRIIDCGVARVTAGEFAGTIAVRLRADAFCHSMVRSVVGALVAVGSGLRDAAWLSALVDRDKRAKDVRVMPPHGLVLEEVGYPPPNAWAARQLTSRARRDEPGHDEEVAR